MAIAAEWEKLIADGDAYRRSHFFGKYRGIVTDNNDPEKLGRVAAKVPSVLAGEEVWCLPVSPFAGDSHGLFLIPKVDDGVWVEFEAGDLSRPLWTGCWWAKGEVPSPNGVEQHVLTTPKGLQIILDDDAKKMQLKHPGGGEISITDSTITIKIGTAKIELSSTGVSVNGGALEVK